MEVSDDEVETVPEPPPLAVEEITNVLELEDVEIVMLLPAEIVLKRRSTPLLES